MTKSKPLRFTIDDAQRAADEWGFNCGPSSICAVLNLTPNELRPYLGDFEKKFYTNPSLMIDILKRLGVEFCQTYRSDNPSNTMVVKFGLMRVQWGGPWTNPGVPMRVRYRHTHWVAVNDGEVFDINAMCVGGWLSWKEWSEKLVPWLIKECCPKGNGTWWLTHGIEIISWPGNGSEIEL